MSDRRTYHFSVLDPQDMASALPSIPVQTGPRGVQPKPQLVAHHQPQFALVAARHMEARNALLAQACFPAHGNVLLLVMLLDAPVILRLEVDERAQDVLVVIAVFVAQENGLCFLRVQARAVKVAGSGLRVVSPQLLQFVDL